MYEGLEAKIYKGKKSRSDICFNQREFILLAPYTHDVGVVTNVPKTDGLSAEILDHVMQHSICLLLPAQTTLQQFFLIYERFTPKGRDITVTEGQKRRNIHPETH